MELQLVTGRPENCNGRLGKEIRVYDLLDELGITYERIDHEAAETMEACEAVDAMLAPAVICKNLFLCNTQKTKFYLLMIRGDKKFKTKEISHQINSPRLSFAPQEYMEEYLDITPGCMRSNRKHHIQRQILTGWIKSQEAAWKCQIRVIVRN